MTGMIKGFLWGWNFRGALIDLSRDFVRYSKQSEG